MCWDDCSKEGYHCLRKRVMKEWSVFNLLFRKGLSEIHLKKFENS